MPNKALKQWPLTEEETITSFESWKNNMVYILSLEEKFLPFLEPGCEWTKAKETYYRGFTGRGAATKAASLDLMLGQIANFVPVISRNTIVRNSTSLKSIWNSIRLYYGIQSNGARFIDFLSIEYTPTRRHEAVYQEMVAFVEDNLLTTEGGLKHHGQVMNEEEMSPTLENLIVLLWLQRLHPQLPTLVKQQFGTELRKQTLASLRPEISQCIPTMLSKLDSQLQEESTVCQLRSDTRHNVSGRRAQCPICKAARRPNANHYLTKCKYLPEEDRAYLLKGHRPKTRTVTIEVPVSESEEDSEDEEIGGEEVMRVNQAVNRRVDVKKSPCFKAFFKHNPVSLTLDTGAETNLIKASLAQFLGVRVKRSSQTARQADGVTPLNITGETSFTVTRNGIDLVLEALVVADMDVEILAGIPFMIKNDISVRPATNEITIKGSKTFQYNQEVPSNGDHVVRRTQAHVLRAPEHITLWPGDYMEIAIPDAIAKEDTIAVEPRQTSKNGNQWPEPQLTEVVDGHIRLSNSSETPVAISKNDHFCQVLPVCDCKTTSAEGNYSASVQRTSPAEPFSNNVTLDPDDIMPPNVHSSFRAALERFDSVFDPKYKGYNGYYGDFKAVVNMGPVLPPQRKGRIPQYSRNKLVELQEVFDKLESDGVFKRPEEAGITVEYLNPSFLVRKSSGGHRLVTAFTDVGRYCKPSPSTMPDVDSTLRTIAGWTYIIVTDLTSAFYQIPLSHDSMRYCGVATPFKGIRVYQRAAMGMPGSETALEELMCRVLGPLLQAGFVAKLADDLFCGGNSFEELLSNFTSLLEALHQCDLRLSSKKTVICPKTTTVLGWIWQQGTITASPHRISTLCQAAIPTTVKGLRSFIGAYKFLGRVLPGCAAAIAPLDTAIAGMKSLEKLTITEELVDHFTYAQKHLQSHKTITLPRASDMLWIVTDGSVKNVGIGSTMYVSRGDKIRLAGFFSAKLQKHHSKWLPCEIEALGIAASIKHFSPYIVQSKHQCCVLTDSKPCMQAHEKLSRGEFSHSPRLATFLSVASRYHVSIRHLAGAANVPSDFASRNAPECTHTTCQVCSFVKRLDESVVRSISYKDIVTGTAAPPFSNRPAWALLQAECSDLRRTHAHLTQGTKPSRKVNNARNVKRYLHVATISRDGLLTVQKNEPLVPSRELIIVPQNILAGLVTAIHVNMDHPSAHQLKQIFDRKFYALNATQCIKDVTENCHICASLKSVPKHLVKQSTSVPPEVIGSSFAADVMRQNRQMIFVLRETVTSYTVTRIIENETHEALRSAIICCCIELRPLSSIGAVVRVDPAPGFVALRNDASLAQNGIAIELGRAKNINKNPVAERAIQELEEELLRSPVQNRTITHMKLALATARLNTRIRASGLSSREMLMQRDQFTHTQLSISDKTLIKDQHVSRQMNHPHSERSKANGDLPVKVHDLKAGDLVFLKQERSKNNGRERYIVTSTDGDYCHVMKFTGPQIRSTLYKLPKSECELLPSLRPGEEDIHEVESKQMPTQTMGDDNIKDQTEMADTPKPTSLPPLPELLTTV